MTHIDFRALDKPVPAEIQQPDDALIAYIADHLPNAKARKERDAQILDNEHAIRRWIEE